MSFLDLATDCDEDGPQPLTINSRNLGARTDISAGLEFAESYVNELIKGVTDENLHQQPENVREMYIVVKKYGMPLAFIK